MVFLIHTILIYLEENLSVDVEVDSFVARSVDKVLQKIWPPVYKAMYKHEWLYEWINGNYTYCTYHDLTFVKKSTQQICYIEYIFCEAMSDLYRSIYELQCVMTFIWQQVWPLLTSTSESLAANKELYGQVNATEPAFCPHFVLLMSIKIDTFYFAIAQ